MAKPSNTDTAKPERKRGGQPGNVNTQRHGLRGGKLPPGCAYIENAVNSLRRQVEAAVIEQKGEINIVDAAAINSILKWERHGLLASHWLRKEATTLTPADRLRFSEAIAKASDQRDRNIRVLGLGVQVAKPWTALPAPEGEDDE